MCEPDTRKYKYVYMINQEVINETISESATREWIYEYWVFPIS
jgi:hypothetical protein